MKTNKKRIIKIFVISIFSFLLFFFVIEENIMSKIDNFFQQDKYSFVDMTNFNVDAKGYSGAVFDGRYIYFIPIRNTYKRFDFSGVVARYDTKSKFTSSSSWSFFNLTQLHPEAKGFGGGVFDGRYVYLVPNYNDKKRSGLVVRFDSVKQFDSPSSWEFFDISLLNPRSKGFYGGVFDGRFIYFVPHHNGENYSGEIARYDTKQPFYASSSWSFFDTTSINNFSRGFVQAIFDGRYIYFIPNRLNTNDYNGQVTRYDTSKPFNAPYAWSFFNTTRLNAKSKGFAGGVFDGRYIYLAPLFLDSKNFNGLVTRYDTTLPFKSSRAWSFFDTSKINTNSKGFVSAIFDGKYVYFVPFRSGYAPPREIDPESYLCEDTNSGGFSGQITRYNTTLLFNSSSAWSFFDLTKIQSKLKGFWGGVFDGRYIYLTPAKTESCVTSGRVVRFDTLENKKGLISFSLGIIHKFFMNDF